MEHQVLISTDPKQKYNCKSNSGSESENHILFTEDHKNLNNFMYYQLTCTEPFQEITINETDAGSSKKQNPLVMTN